MAPTNLKLYADGLCEPRNPGGWACWAWCALDDDVMVAQDYGCIGHGSGMTNNLAEYTSALQALRWLDAGGHSGATMHVDSRLVANQVNGQWAVRSRTLWPLCAEARALVAVTGTRLVWVPRERNVQADALTRMAYAEARGAMRRA